MIIFVNNKSTFFVKLHCLLKDLFIKSGSFFLLRSVGCRKLRRIAAVHRHVLWCVIVKARSRKSSAKLTTNNAVSFCTYCLKFYQLRGYVCAFIACAFSAVPSALWHCWLAVRKSTRPVKIDWWCVDVVICLGRGSDCLHVVQLMPLQSPNPIISCLV